MGGEVQRSVAVDHARLQEEVLTLRLQRTLLKDKESRSVSPSRHFALHAEEVRRPNSPFRQQSLSAQERRAGMSPGRRNTSSSPSRSRSMTPERSKAVAPKRWPDAMIAHIHSSPSLTAAAQRWGTMQG